MCDRQRLCPRRHHQMDLRLAEEWLENGSQKACRQRRPVAATGQGKCTTPGRMDLGQGPCGPRRRSEEHTSELQSLMRISYAVFCLKKNNTYAINTNNIISSKPISLNTSHTY